MGFANLFEAMAWRLVKSRMTWAFLAAFAALVVAGVTALKAIGALAPMAAAVSETSSDVALGLSVLDSASGGGEPGRGMRRPLRPGKLHRHARRRVLRGVLRRGHSQRCGEERGPRRRGALLLRVGGVLSDAGANAIVAAGMGMRPMMGFANAGIDVLFDNVTPNVGDVAKLAAEGKLPHMTANEACHH